MPPITTPIHAMSSVQATQALVELLLEKRHQQSQTGFFTRRRSHQLLNAGADPNALLEDGTPLLVHTISASRGDLMSAAASVLLDAKGIDVNAVDAQGRSAAFYVHGNTCMEHLLRHPELDLTLRDHNGQTALEFQKTHPPTEGDAKDFGFSGDVWRRRGYELVLLKLRNYSWLQEQFRSGQSFDVQGWLALHKDTEGMVTLEVNHDVHSAWRNTLLPVLHHGKESGTPTREEILSRTTIQALGEARKGINDKEVLALMELCEAQGSPLTIDDLTSTGLWDQMVTQRQVHHIFQRKFWDGKPYPGCQALWQDLPEDTKSQLFTQKKDLAKDMAHLFARWVLSDDAKTMSGADFRRMVHVMPEEVRQAVPHWHQILMVRQRHERSQETQAGRV